MRLIVFLADALKVAVGSNRQAILDSQCHSRIRL